LVRQKSNKGLMWSN